MTRLSLIALAFLAVPAAADVGDKLADDGTLNPEQQTIAYFANEKTFELGDSMFCTYGYWAAKSGDHASAKKIFDKCVAAGVDGAFPWEAFLSQNGMGTRESLEDAAEWDRKSAERGYKVGQFNYGLSLLRGHGVKKDVEAGKKLIDAAAAKGFEAAIELKNAGYNPDVAVPDADEKRIY